MAGPMPGRAGQREGETIPGGLTLVPDLALPEIGPAEEFLVDLFDKTYGKLPIKGAARLRWAVEEHQAAEARGDSKRAEELLRHAAALQAVLDKHARCRRCGRDLKRPESIARRVGPECLNKEGR